MELQKYGSDEHQILDGAYFSRWREESGSKELQQYLFFLRVCLLLLLFYNKNNQLCSQENKFKKKKPTNLLTAFQDKDFERFIEINNLSLNIYSSLFFQLLLNILRTLLYKIHLTLPIILDNTGFFPKRTTIKLCFQTLKKNLIQQNINLNYVTYACMFHILQVKVSYPSRI